MRCSHLLSWLYEGMTIEIAASRKLGFAPAQAS
jgi:hypothetical protein